MHIKSQEFIKDEILLNCSQFSSGYSQHCLIDEKTLESTSVSLSIHKKHCDNCQHSLDSKITPFSIDLCRLKDNSQVLKRGEWMRQVIMLIGAVLVPGSLYTHTSSHVIRLLYTDMTRKFSVTAQVVKSEFSLIS